MRHGQCLEQLFYDCQVTGTESAFRPGMAPPIDILLPGGRDTAVLLFHGLTGTPLEMRALGQELARDGYTVHIPLLPGRGTQPDDMDDLCWEDWMDAALRAYDTPRAGHRALG